MKRSRAGKETQARGKPVWRGWCTPMEEEGALRIRSKRKGGVWGKRFRNELDGGRARKRGREREIALEIKRASNRGMAKA